VTTGSNGRAYVIAGPTAVGKGTLVKELKRRHPDIFVSVSATTRKPRPGERDGVDYHFVATDDFESLINSGGLLEWAKVHNSDYYGTPAAPVQQAIAAGMVAVLEIDLQGARQSRKLLPSAVQIFIAPPSWDELVRRLAGRGSETTPQMQRRLETARTELAAEAEFDHVVVNDTVEAAVCELVKLMGLSNAG
jgi:guanylate kinase